jgi:hypothetical protein
VLGSLAGIAEVAREAFGREAGPGGAAGAAGGPWRGSAAPVGTDRAR